MYTPLPPAGPPACGAAGEGWLQCSGAQAAVTGAGHLHAAGEGGLVFLYGGRGICDKGRVLDNCVKSALEAAVTGAGHLYAAGEGGRCVLIKYVADRYGALVCVCGGSVGNEGGLLEAC